MPFKAGVEGILLSCVGSSGQTRNGSRGHQYPNETLAERSLVYRRIFKCMRKTVLPFNLKVVQILIKSLATFFSAVVPVTLQCLLKPAWRGSY